jgi:hypothetical protein
VRETKIAKNANQEQQTPIFSQAQTKTINTHKTKTKQTKRGGKGPANQSVGQGPS